VCLDQSEAQRNDQRDSVFAATYRLLRERLPEADVQIAAVSNTLFLLPSGYRAARRKNHTRLGALRRAMASTTAGTVLVDGEMLGDIESMGADAVLEKVLASASR
jgi:hypothetical protein